MKKKRMKDMKSFATFLKKVAQKSAFPESLTLFPAKPSGLLSVRSRPVSHLIGCASMY
jgi:hypothetical protein